MGLFDLYQRAAAAISKAVNDVRKPVPETPSQAPSAPRPASGVRPAVHETIPAPKGASGLPTPSGEAAIDAMVKALLVREGGFVNNPNDSGGATNEGISLKYLRRVGLARGDLNHDGVIDEKDILAVTPAIAGQFYKEDFYLHPGINQLPDGLQPQVFDIAVNAGPPRAVMLLQEVLAKALGIAVRDDGVLGPTTVGLARKAVAQDGLKEITNDLVDARKAFYNRTVARYPQDKVFLKGWLRRAEQFRVQ